METKNIGQGMFAVACVLGLALLTFLFGNFEEHQKNPNQHPDSIQNAQFIEVNLERNRQGHYVVSGSINDKPVVFLLDTGATDVVIPGVLAAQLDLKAGRSGRAMTANGPVTIYETRVDHLQIGDISLFNVPASINPAMQSPGILLGMSALGQLEFVQSGDSLTLRQNGY